MNEWDRGGGDAPPNSAFHIAARRERAPPLASRRSVACERTVAGARAEVQLMWGAGGRIVGRIAVESTGGA